MKTLIAGIVIIIVVIAGIVYGVSHKSSNKNTNTNSYSQPTTSTNNQKAASTNTNQAATAASVTIQNMMFTPSQVTIKKGETVTWTNKDSVAHTVTDDLTNVGGPDSSSIAPGTTYSFTFSKTGSFQYHCSIHPSMRGTIVVQ